MSWVTEEWTSGLSGQVLQKVKELQALNEKLSRERQQRQLQLDNSEVALHKQKQKYEEVRAELAAAQRELVGVREQAQGEARARERLAQDLQAKASQVCTLEGQLDAARTLSQKLALEVKRLEAELEKLQKDSVSGDSMLFSTPCWNINSPWDQSGKSVARGEAESKSQNVSQQLLFGETPKPSVGVAPSPFPQRQHNSPPLRRRVHQSEAHTPSAVFPWERGDTKSAPRRRPQSSPASSFPSVDVAITDTTSRDDGIEEALRKEIDGLRVCVSGLQQELQLEKECSRETECRLAQAQKERNTHEQNLTRSRDELARTQTRITQESDRAQAAEQRVKQLQEELKCQRQNAETSRCNAEQRRKEMEREHQKELQEMQKEKQSMERLHQQESNKLNQEIQQARTLHNALQTQHDKLVLQKQALERDLEEVRGKLKNTQAELTEVQKSEARLQAKHMESLKENEALNVSVEQLKKRERSLEAEVKRLTEELAEALRIIKELQAKLAAPPPQETSRSFTPVAGDSFTSVRSIPYEHSPPIQHSALRKKAQQIERVTGSGRPGSLNYLSDREPGEGIDSEDISEYESKDSPSLGLGVQERNHRGPGRSGESGGESSITEQDTGIEDTDTDSYMSDSTSDRVFKDDIHCDLGSSKGNRTEEQKRNSASLGELKKENAILRDELKDMKRELEQRLEDLEIQRRSESEARTKLKQLSKKHSSQAEQHRTKAQELKEKGNKLEAQLEVEKKESARLLEVIATLESEAEKRQKEGEREEKDSKEETMKIREALAEMERKKELLEEEREKMCQELEVLQSELLQEREAREREREEEKKRCKHSEVDELKIAGLQAELDLSATVEGKNVKNNMPLTYLQLGNQPNTTNEVTALENMSSPNANASFCESNLQNSMAREEPNIPLLTECETGSNSRKHSLAEEDRASAGNPDQAKSKDLDNTTVLVLELERMRVQRDREAERAKKAQKNLEALQNQVTGQTQQLTLAFENQSKHIEGLLRELQDRDATLQRQGEELQLCLEELTSYKADKRMREVNSGTLNTDQTDQVSVYPVCDPLVASSTDEITTLEASQTVNNRAIQPHHRHFTNIQVANETDKDNAASDKSCMNNMVKENVSLPTSDVHARDPAHCTEITGAKELLKTLTTAQQGSAHVVDSNAKGTDSSVILSPSRLTENPTNYTGTLKTIINELHEQHSELAQLKAENDQLPLQLQEVSMQDYLTLKQENEQLKLKLKLLDTEQCLSEEPSQQEPGPAHLTNTKEEKTSAKNEAEHYVDIPCLEEKVGMSRGSENGGSYTKVVAGYENEKNGNEAYNSAQVHSIQEQLQVLQTHLQLLSEQNKEQAEELQLWRLSSMSPGETTNQKSSPIVLVREEQLVLSCSPSALHTHSRSMVQPGGYPGFEGADHHQDDQSLLEQTTEKPIIKTMEQITHVDGVIKHIKDDLKREGSTGVFFCRTEKVDDQHTLHQLTKMTNDAHSHESQSQKETFVPQSQEEGSSKATFKTKVIDPKLNTGPVKVRDPCASGLVHDETIAVEQHGEAPVRSPMDFVLQEGCAVLTEPELDQHESCIVTETTAGPNQARTKEIKNVCTPTIDECSRMKVKDSESYSLPNKRQSILPTSPQTNTEQTVLHQVGSSVLTSSPQTNAEHTMFIHQQPSILPASIQTSGEQTMFIRQGPSILSGNIQANADQMMLFQQGPSFLTASPQTGAENTVLLQQEPSDHTASTPTNTEQALIQRGLSVLPASDHSNGEQTMLLWHGQNILPSNAQTNTAQTMLIQQRSGVLTASPQMNAEPTLLICQGQSILPAKIQTSAEQMMPLQQGPSDLTASPQTNAENTTLLQQGPTVHTASHQINSELMVLLKQGPSVLTASDHTNGEQTMVIQHGPSILTASPETNTEQVMPMHQEPSALPVSPQTNIEQMGLIQQRLSILPTTGHTSDEQTILIQHGQNIVASNPQNNAAQTMLIQQGPSILTASPETNTEQVMLIQQGPSVLTANIQTNTDQTVLIQHAPSALPAIAQTKAEQTMLIQQRPSVLHASTQTIVIHQTPTVLHASTQTVLLQQSPSILHASTQTIVIHQTPTVLHASTQTVLLQQSSSILHASTQTSVEQIMYNEELKKEEDKVTGSLLFSSTPSSETEKLLFAGSFPIPANPAHLAERIRRNRSRMSAAYDDTEYEPYGLPEVVMKGFADIPSGPACPYVLRRGLLGTDALPLSLREPPIKEEVNSEDIDP